MFIASLGKILSYVHTLEVRYFCKMFMFGFMNCICGGCLWFFHFVCSILALCHRNSSFCHWKFHFLILSVTKTNFAHRIMSHFSMMLSDIFFHISFLLYKLSRKEVQYPATTNHKIQETKTNSATKSKSVNKPMYMTYFLIL